MSEINETSIEELRKKKNRERSLLYYHKHKDEIKQRLKDNPIRKQRRYEYLKQYTLTHRERYREKVRRYSKRRHAEYKIRGLCFCGRPTRPNKKTCSVCAAIQHVCGVQQYLKRKSLGRCLQCGRQPEDGFKQCKICRKYKRQEMKIRRVINKQLVIEHYGGCCNKCGETNLKFLTINHINGGGCKERRIKGSHDFYRLLIKNNFPIGYDVKCWNCNWLAYLETLSTPDPSRNLDISAKQLAINHYGGKCQCCGITDYKLLTIDHVNNDGNLDRKKYKIKPGASYYRWLQKQGWPNNLITMCFNCNCGRAFNNGICPHKT